MQLWGSLSILWHSLSLGLEWKLTFSSPVATAEFSKFAGILSAAVSQHHLLALEMAQLECRSGQVKITFHNNPLSDNYIVDMWRGCWTNIRPESDGVLWVEPTQSLANGSAWCPGLRPTVTLAVFIVLGCAWGLEDAQDFSQGSSHGYSPLGSDEINDIRWKK